MQQMVCFNNLLFLRFYANSGGKYDFLLYMQMFKIQIKHSDISHEIDN